MTKIVTQYKDADGALYVKAGHLGKLFGLGRTTVWRELNKMRAVPKYKGSFIDISYGLRLVKVADFEQFLKDKNNQYLRK